MTRRRLRCRRRRRLYLGGRLLRSRPVRPEQPAPPDRVRPGVPAGRPRLPAPGDRLVRPRSRLLRRLLLIGHDAHLLQARRIHQRRGRRPEVDHQNEERGRERREDGDDQVIDQCLHRDVGVALPLDRADQPDQDVVALRFGDHLRELGKLDALILLGEGRGDARLELCGDDDVAEIEAGQHDAG